MTATVGATTWDTSLMPMGDETLFLALPAPVRRAEDLDDGDAVSARVRPRPPAAAGSRGPSTRAAPGEGRRLVVPCRRVDADDRADADRASRPDAVPGPAASPSLATRRARTAPATRTSTGTPW